MQPVAASTSCPYLSIVVTSRNDDHGGNLIRRTQLFVDGFIAQCQRHNLRAELILVEWNPPENHPGLARVLSWPSQQTNCSVRIIEVPSNIHGRFKNSDRLPLFQMIGKNVGIRRARGLFVLATNIDILFSDELMCFLASGRLQKKYLYRVDRYDVAADLPAGAAIDAQLRHCSQNILRICSREGTRTVATNHFHYVYFKQTWRERVHEKMQDWGIVPVIKKSRLHTNACGDFTLLAREQWAALRGYPELETFSFHLDSVLCHAAHHGGGREKVLPSPMRIYHIEHAAGSGWTPEGQNKLDRRLDAAGIPQLSHDQFDEWALKMRCESKPIIFNDENWGLANENLHEWNI
jgi:hypothetical protein